MKITVQNTTEHSAKLQLSQVISYVRRTRGRDFGYEDTQSESWCSFYVPNVLYVHLPLQPSRATLLVWKMEYFIGELAKVEGCQPGDVLARMKAEHVTE